jgi:hypothetical protein
MTDKNWVLAAENNPDTTRAYVIEAVEPIEDSLTELHRKIDVLLPKDKVNREVLPLRDPIDMNLFPFFFTNAGSKAKRRKDLKQAQLRLPYTLLYHTGLMDPCSGVGRTKAAFELLD